MVHCHSRARQVVHRRCGRQRWFTMWQTAVVQPHCARQRWFTMWQTAVVQPHCAKQRWFTMWQTAVVQPHCARQRWFIAIVADSGGSSPLWQTAVVHRHSIVADSGGSSPATRVPCHRTSRPAGPRGTDDTDKPLRLSGTESSSPQRPQQGQTD